MIEKEIKEVIDYLVRFIISKEDENVKEIEIPVGLLNKLQEEYIFKVLGHNPTTEKLVENNEITLYGVKFKLNKNRKSKRQTLQ